MSTVLQERICQTAQHTRYFINDSDYFSFVKNILLNPLHSKVSYGIFQELITRVWIWHVRELKSIYPIPTIMHLCSC